jgi:acid phosphatase (class A)
MRRLAKISLSAVLLAGCAATPRTEPMANAKLQPGDQGSRLAGGYLLRGAAPNSLVFVPPPPAPGSAALARDEEGARAAVALRGSPRWEQATIDADLFKPDSTGVFSCAAGFTISAETTPRLITLLRRAGPDLALAVYPTKRLYKRSRPFMVNGQPTCTPNDEAVLRADGSYPSGHSAIGYGWSLLLAEVVPDRAAQIIARGLAFGDSRRICNVHWLSDIEQGRSVAAAVVARLHAEPAFRADLEAARAEVAARRAQSPPPDCAREDAALASAER